MAYCYCLGCSNLLNYCTCKKGETMKQMTPKEARRVIGTIRKLTAEYFANANKKYAVLGVSGGLDSAVVAGIMSGIKTIKTIGCILPCESNPIDATLAGKVINKYKLCPVYQNLYPEYLSVFTELKDMPYKLPVHDIPEDRLNRAYGNIKARLRMITLYHIAQIMNGIVVGTGNRTELEIGYGTKYGDDGVDIQPIGDLYKYEVYAVAKQLGVPIEIQTRPPSAGLFEGQTDEKEIGMTYKEIDSMLIGDTPRSVNLVQRIKANQHKLSLPPVFKK